MSRNYLIRTKALHKIDELIQSLDGDPMPLLTRYQLTLASLSSEQQTMHINDLVSLLNDCAEQFNCADFGLQLGAKQDFLMLGPLGVVLMNCRTAREAMHALRGFMCFHNQSEYWNYQEHGDMVLIQRHDHFLDISDSRQYKELALSANFHLSKLLLGTKFILQRVEFSHAPLADSVHYRRLFKTDVVFNREHDQIIVAKGFLDIPLDRGDDRLKIATANYLSELKQEFVFDIVQQVITLVQQTLSSQEANLQHIADLLKVNKRTLQRQLKQHNIIFKQLVNEMRLKKAYWYLESSQMDITLLSDILGYTDISSFSRAFKASTGYSPLMWRKRLLAVNSN
ncbi:AraC family transcriptional regulator [Aliiglaciecola sp. LCG003]|uniref:AraC family transcriptional regulator n=1 Tax=Aliiglaciecola sp. LCG003 TaxID=3053655 RepID=UPI0025730B14|nr:AraC family transcriptional regulator [Aliiglaciecola sp. LCG003]WJG07636.1 AraC family transcriptional regulator ligand-binding domain-containing protein [Aliiglaciecola sp. LCG003]